MSTPFFPRPISACALAANAALAALVLTQVPLAARAQSVEDLTQSQSSLEVGAMYVNSRSFKFGESSGLRREGFYGIGGFDIVGPQQYDSPTTERWRVTGSNLGLSTRSLEGEYGRQGDFRLRLGYDELPRYRSDTFQSPYRGAGSDTLTLPAGWGATGNTTRTMPKLITSMESVDLRTQRTRYDFGFLSTLNAQWEVRANASREYKDGIKALGAPIVAARGAILPDPVRYQTDQFDANLGYRGERGHFQLGYYGSLFTNEIKSLTFDNPFQPTASAPTTGRMSSAPDSQFHQLNAAGALTLAPRTKLVVNGSYGRMTQNQSFLPYGTVAAASPALPIDSLNGVVLNKTLSVKLTARPDRDLALLASYKFDERRDKTPVHHFNGWFDADATGTLPGPNERANTPYSRKLQQFLLDGDYQFQRGHWLRAGVDHQAIDRWCNGTWVNCADAPHSRELTERLEYRTHLNESLSARLGVSHSARRVSNYDQYANILASFVGAQGLYSQLQASGYTVFGPLVGANVPPVNTTLFGAANNTLSVGDIGAGIDVLGLRRFNYADRDRNKLRSALNWDANDVLSFSAGFDVNSDSYGNSPYGLQGAKSWAVNLDAAWRITEQAFANVFYSYEDIRSDTQGRAWANNATTTTYAGIAGGCSATALAAVQTAKIDPCREWNADMRDKVHSVGTGWRINKLDNERLDLFGDVVLSRARTLTNVTGGSYYAIGTAPNQFFTFIPAEALPDVISTTVSFRLQARYRLNRQSTLQFTYWMQHLTAKDFQYLATGPTALSGVIGTNEQSPSYRVQVAGAAYIHRF